MATSPDDLTHVVDTLTHVVETCAWCGSPLAADAQVLIAGGRFSGWSARLETLRGHVVQVRTSHGLTPVQAVVPLPDTPAHHAGYDLLFVLCSEACRDDLDLAIGQDPMLVSIADAPERPIRRRSGGKAPRASGPARRALLRRRPS